MAQYTISVINEINIIQSIYFYQTSRLYGFVVSHLLKSFFATSIVPIIPTVPTVPSVPIVITVPTLTFHLIELYLIYLKISTALCILARMSTPKGQFFSHAPHCIQSLAFAFSDL
jgi:hypothetical protein